MLLWGMLWRRKGGRGNEILSSSQPRATPNHPKLNGSTTFPNTHTHTHRDLTWPCIYVVYVVVVGFVHFGRHSRVDCGLVDSLFPTPLFTLYLSLSVCLSHLVCDMRKPSNWPNPTSYIYKYKNVVVSPSLLYTQTYLEYAPSSGATPIQPLGLACSKVSTLNRVNRQSRAARFCRTHNAKRTRYEKHKRIYTINIYMYIQRDWLAGELERVVEVVWQFPME